MKYLLVIILVSIATFLYFLKAGAEALSESSERSEEERKEHKKDAKKYFWIFWTYFISICIIGMILNIN